jgi:hypothetical protein
MGRIGEMVEMGRMGSGVGEEKRADRWGRGRSQKRGELEWAVPGQGKERGRTSGGWGNFEFWILGQEEKEKLEGGKG